MESNLLENFEGVGQAAGQSIVDGDRTMRVSSLLAHCSLRFRRAAGQSVHDEKEAAIISLYVLTKGHFVLQAGHESND
jgi:hypothetical protein